MIATVRLLADQSVGLRAVAITASTYCVIVGRNTGGHAERIHDMASGGAPRISATPEPVWARLPGGGIGPAILLRLGPAAPWLDLDRRRLLTVAEALHLLGWRRLDDTSSGGLIDLHSWGLVLDGEHLVSVRRPAAAELWNGRLHLSAKWRTTAVSLPGPIVAVFAVPDSLYDPDQEFFADRLREATRQSHLLGARIPLKDGHGRRLQRMPARPLGTSAHDGN